MLSRHGSNLARPVVIHDIIHGLIYVPSTPYCAFSWVSPDGSCAYVHWGYFTSKSKSVRQPSELRGSLSPTSVYCTWQSQSVTHPIMNRARRCLTSVMEQRPMSKRRIKWQMMRWTRSGWTQKLLHVRLLAARRTGRTANRLYGKITLRLRPSQRNASRTQTRQWKGSLTQYPKGMIWLYRLKILWERVGKSPILNS